MWLQKLQFFCFGLPRPRQWVINLIELISNLDGIERQVLNAIDTE